jgi:hypothetical protein
VASLQLTLNRPELFRVDSRRPDNVIGRDTSAELHVSSVSNDRQDSHDTDAHDEPTDNITRTSAQLLRPVNIEEIEKRMQTCLRENRTSPYKLAELCGMFPGHEPESLRRVVSCEEQVEEEETDRIIFLTWVSLSL